MKQYKDSQTYSIYIYQNDDVQDFDVRWDQALLSANETLTDTVLEGLYKSTICRFLFSFRLYWLCMTKKRHGTIDKVVILD